MQSSKLAGITKSTAWNLFCINLFGTNWRIVMKRFSVTAFVGFLVLSTSWVYADIYQWRVNNNVIYESTILASGGSGVNAVPGANLSGRNLTQAYLLGKDLSGALLRGTRLESALLDNANLSHADLSNALIHGASIENANFTGANIRGARFVIPSYNDGFGSILTASQLYSTASYQSRDLVGVALDNGNLADFDFSNQNLTDASFAYKMLGDFHPFSSNLTNANFTGAIIEGIDLAGTTTQGFTANQFYSTASYQSGNLRRVDLGQNNLSGWNFAGKDLTGATFYTEYFQSSNLTGANFAGANLTDATMISTNLANANLSNAILVGTQLSYAQLTGANITGADIRGASLQSSGMTIAQLSSTATYSTKDLSEINLGGNNLTNADFSGYNLSKVVFSGSTLTGADFTGANITQAAFANTVSKGLTSAQFYATANYKAKDLRGIALSSNTFDGWDFSEQNLSENDLSSTVWHNTYFDDANLSSATFDRAKFTNASFPGVDLSNARLTNANLIGVDFADADLTRTNFNAAKLENVNLRTARINATNFEGVNFSNTDFSGNDLSKASFIIATLTGANLSGAVIQEVNFTNTTSRGFTSAQLYSTASYQSRDLTGVILAGNNLTGWSFAGINLSKANFRATTLTNTNFTGAIIQEANFHDTTSKGFTSARLYSTASYQSKDLSGIILTSNNLTGWSFAGVNLTNARFLDAVTANTDFTGANIEGAWFSKSSLTSTDTGISKNQLYSTASYKARELPRLELIRHDLNGWDFSGQNLTQAYFFSSSMQSTNFMGADLRSAQHVNLSSSLNDNLIRPDGTINGLYLYAGRRLTVRNFRQFSGAPFPINVTQSFYMDPTGVLELRFDATNWDSLIKVSAGTPITLTGGTLELDFLDDVNITDQIGRTMDLFDWAGIVPTGSFNVLSPYTWDLTNLYSTGEVTLLGAPTLPGDFDGDGVVGGRDLLAWQRNPSIGSLVAWQANYGDAVSTLNGIAAVPEPASALFAILILSTITLKRRMLRKSKVLILHSPQ
jgi:uncharacterized protein YjbI with pentapeptide repeats